MNKLIITLLFSVALAGTAFAWGGWLQDQKVGSLSIEGNIYTTATTLTAGYALCRTSTGFLGHCTTTPTNGACTCAIN